jgi:hypothetical protein
MLASREERRKGKDNITCYFCANPQICRSIMHNIFLSPIEEIGKPISME